MAQIDVIVVDSRDRPVGKMEKLEAHIKGQLHRAITVYVFNAQQQLLLQRRARDKYHCGGLWSNTTCGHPYPGESTLGAAQRRLAEEMGLQPALTPVFELSYHLTMSNGLIEHEYGHVFFAQTDALPKVNPQEADAWRYASVDEIATEMALSPACFTPWFLHTFESIPAQAAAFFTAAVQRG